MVFWLPRLHQEVIGPFRDDLSVLLLHRSSSMLHGLLLASSWKATSKLVELPVAIVDHSGGLTSLMVLCVHLLVEMLLTATIASLALLEALVLPLNKILHFMSFHVPPLCLYFSDLLYGEVARLGHDLRIHLVGDNGHACLGSGCFDFCLLD